MAHKVIYVKTIGSCNLDCKHCFTNGKSGDPTQFDIEATLTWLENYVSSNTPDTHYHVELHGGEPFLVKLDKLRDFATRAQQIVPNNASFGCTSNLTFPITDGHVAFIKEVLEGSIATSWDPYMRWETPKQVEQWKQSIRTLAAHDLHPKVIVVITKQLMIDYDAKSFCDTLIGMGVKHIDVMRLTMNGSASCNAGGLFPDNDVQDKWFLDLLKYYQLYEVQKDLVIYTIDDLVKRLSENLVESNTNCRNCEQNLVTINSNGTLGTCPNSATNKNYSHISKPVVDFLEHDLRVESQAVEQDHDIRCLTCDVFDLCGGDCHKLNWDSRCGGWKRTLHHLSGRPYNDDLIFKG